MKMYRQGDLLIVEDSAMTRTDRATKASPVLLHGETTGHAHRVEGNATVLDGVPGVFKAIVASAPFKVVHEEHDTIEIPEGTYRVVRQREYDEGEIRYVSD